MEDEGSFTDEFNQWNQWQAKSDQWSYVTPLKGDDDTRDDTRDDLNMGGLLLDQKDQEDQEDHDARKTFSPRDF